MNRRTLEQVGQVCRAAFGGNISGIVLIRGAYFGTTPPPPPTYATHSPPTDYFIHVPFINNLVNLYFGWRLRLKNKIFIINFWLIKLADDLLIILNFLQLVIIKT